MQFIELIAGQPMWEGKYVLFKVRKFANFKQKSHDIIW